MVLRYEGEALSDNLKDPKSKKVDILVSISKASIVFQLCFLTLRFPLVSRYHNLQLYAKYIPVCEGKMVTEDLRHPLFKRAAVLSWTPIKRIRFPVAFYHVCDANCRSEGLDRVHSTTSTLYAYNPLVSETMYAI